MSLSKRIKSIEGWRSSPKPLTLTSKVFQDKPAASKLEVVKNADRQKIRQKTENKQ